MKYFTIAMSNMKEWRNMISSFISSFKIISCKRQQNIFKEFVNILYPKLKDRRYDGQRSFQAIRSEFQCEIIFTVKTICAISWREDGFLL